MRPNRSTAAATAAWAAAGSVTSRETARRLSCSPRAAVTLAASRAVPTTRWPASRAALASSMPIPRAAPVMNQTAGVVGVVSVMSAVPFWSDVLQSRRPATA